MHAATGTEHDGIAGEAPALPRSSLPDDAPISRFGALYSLTTFAGTLGDDQPPADAWEAPSGSPAAMAVEERRSEMDERILAGLLRS